MIRSLLLIGVILGIAPAAISAEGGTKLAEIKAKIIDIEKNHRKELNRLNDAMYSARQDGDSDKVTQLGTQLQAERKRFRDQAAQFQRKLKEKADATSLGDILAEKRKARKKVEATIKQLRAELNKARKNGDDEQVAKTKKRMQKVESEFVAQLEKMLSKIKAKKTDS